MVRRRTTPTTGRPYRKYLFDQRISQAAVVTLELTVLAMLLGIVLGVTLAVMRSRRTRC